MLIGARANSFRRLLCIASLAIALQACTKKQGQQISDALQPSTPTTGPQETPFDQELRLTINGGARFTNAVAVQLKIETTTTPDEMYLTQSPGCVDGGEWETFSSERSWRLKTTNASNVIFIKVKRAAQESQCTSAEITHDSLAPDNPELVINAAAVWTNLLNVELSLSAISASEMYVSNIPGCGSGGSWETFVPSRPWSLAQSNSVATVYAKFRDHVGNESACVWTQINHDSVAPAVVVTAPSENFTVNSQGQSEVIVSGSCDDSAPVTLSGVVTAQAFCVGTQFFWKANLSSLADGPLQISVQQTDAAGNVSLPITRTFMKETSPPTNLSLIVEGGAVYTALTTVSVALAAIDAAEVWVSNQSDCTYGAWEPMESSKKWDLISVNETTPVYAKFRDQYENESACVGDSIIQDSLPPTWESIPTHASHSKSLTSSPEVTVVLNAQDSVSGFDKYEYSIGTVPSLNDVVDWTALTAGKFTVAGMSLENGTTYYVNVRALDKVGNAQVNSSEGWTVDLEPPQIVFVGNTLGVVTDYDLKLSGTCEAELTIQLAYSSGLSGPSSVSCTDGNFSFYTSITGSSGVRSVKAKQTDAIGNQGSATASFQFQRKIEIGGPIYASKKLTNGNTVYVGNFKSVYDQRDSSIVAVNADGSRAVTLSFSGGFNGPVYGIHELPIGGLLVVGEFTHYRGRPANRIAKLSATGQLDEVFSPESEANGFNAPAHSVAVSGNSIFVGGQFTSYRGQASGRLIKLNLDGSVDSAFNLGAGLNATVKALAVVDQALYVGGEFTELNSLSTNRLAKLDLNTGELDQTFSPTTANGFATGKVNALVSDGNSIFVGGEFTSYRGFPTNRLAKIDLVSGQLDANFSPSASNGTNAEVLALAWGSPNLYVGGRFTSYRGRTVQRLLKLNATGDLDAGFSPTKSNGVDGSVFSILVDGSQLYLGGEFTTYRGQRALHFAKLNSSGVLDLSFNPASGANGSGPGVYSIAKLGTVYVAGGAFSHYRGRWSVGNVAKVLPNGTIDPSFHSNDVGFNGIVRSLWVEPGQSYVVVGGDFTKYRSAKSNRLAKLSLSNGSLDAGFVATGFNRPVNVIKAMGSSLLVGGSFTRYRLQPANYLAKLSLSSGALDANFNPSSGANGANSSVYSIFVDSSQIYIGGAFTIYRNSAAPKISRLNADGSIDMSFANSLGAGFSNGDVRSISKDSNQLWVGGTFTAYKSKAANRIAKLSLPALALDSVFNPATGANGFNGAVYSIVPSGSDVFVGGAFSLYKDQVAMGVAKVSTAGLMDEVFNPQAGAFNGVTNPIVRHLQISATGHLGISGDFSYYRGRPAAYQVKVDSQGNSVEP